MEKQLLKNWVLTQDKTGEEIPARVPGDITYDLWQAGKIINPYVGENYKDLQWIAKEDFTYTAKFDVTDVIAAQEDVSLVFDGIDLFAEIYLNGKLLGKTENMFLQYVYDVKDLLKKTENELVVKMKSTIDVLKNVDMKDHFCIFNDKRMFLRKAQCHFGWDWAPELTGYGIWENVYLVGENKCRIKDTFYVARKNGAVTLVAELNYRAGIIGHPTEKFWEGIEKDGDTLYFYLSKTPFGEDYERKEVAVTGKKNFVNFFVENPQLWWPTGYGEQPLYNYKVELFRGGKLVSEKKGRLALREVDIVEEPKKDEYINFALRVNGVEIFVKGSNWVPADIFTGAIEDEKYIKMIRQAKEGNFNLLRVWGGGLYEKDVFYNTCDELGVMIMQDFMIACSDIPEDMEWLKSATAEVDYQIRRLRNHPSIVMWTGGNEKVGLFVEQVGRGDYFVDCILPGMIQDLDRTRPYIRQSPHSWTDFGCHKTSGDCHYSTYDRCLDYQVDEYRRLVAEVVLPFTSECAIPGPCSVETTKKAFPEDKQWPMNALWEDRYRNNPYSNHSESFCYWEMFFTDRLYGQSTSLEDFTKKAMMAQAEFLRCEEEYARANKGMNWGIVNWMYSDIWPTGTWSLVDYYLEPKQAYYQAKRHFAPHRVTFVENVDGETELVVLNDTLAPFETKIVYGVKTVDGKEITKAKKLRVKVPMNGVYRQSIGKAPEADGAYLYATYEADGEKQKTLYSPKFWKGCKFVSDFKTEIKQLSEKQAQITVFANSFVKSAFISLKDNYKYTYSDNYLDIEAGDKQTVIVTSEEPFDASDIVIEAFVS